MYCTSCGNTLPPETAVCYDCGAATPYNVSSSKNNPSSYDTLPVAGDPLQHMTTPGPQYPGHNSALSRRMMISLVLVSLLILLSGVGLIFYASVLHPAQLRAQATATAQMQLTMAARATAQANAQATGTAQALANATATAQAKATAQSAATATALQSIYNQATSSNPLLDVALNGQDSLNWDQYPAVGGGGCSFFGGALHANVLQKDYYVPCFAQASNFSNFALQVQMTIDKGDGGGLVFRANSASSKFYIFSIANDGSYSLLISLDNNHSNPLTYGNSSAIHTNLNQTNLLTVIARGSYIYLYVNKQYAGSVTDNTYTSGQIGVFGADNANPTDVAFSNLQVWKLP